MTCRDMDDVISSWSGDSLLESEHAKHLTHCGRCRALTVLLDNAEVGFHLSERLLRRMQAGILKDLKPVRPLPPPRILLLACSIVFLSVVAVGALLLGTTGWNVSFRSRAKPRATACMYANRGQGYGMRAACKG